MWSKLSWNFLCSSGWPYYQVTELTVILAAASRAPLTLTLWHQRPCPELQLSAQYRYSWRRYKSLPSSYFLTYPSKNFFFINQTLNRVYARNTSYQNTSKEPSTPTACCLPTPAGPTCSQPRAGLSRFMTSFRELEC